MFLSHLVLRLRTRSTITSLSLKEGSFIDIGIGANLIVHPIAYFSDGSSSKEVGLFSGNLKILILRQLIQLARFMAERKGGYLWFFAPEIQLMFSR